MQGPVYLVSSSNLLPDLVADLHGHGVRIFVRGRIDSPSKGGIRGTFVGLPDAPVTRFAMTIFGGRRRGLLQNERDICAAPQIVAARFAGQNNVGEAFKPQVQTDCRRHLKHRHSKHHKLRRHAK
jgi:hypothetical protein